ncbi:MAG: DUF2795 domain-containing protein [Armatimonadetes bacterium]|nr:DUF2795 domain-containing protein [Armatimonadota bacterium]
MVTVMEITKYLDEYAFPATKEECINMAADNGAPDEVLEVLTRLPDGVYNTIHEVSVLAKADLQ